MYVKPLYTLLPTHAVILGFTRTQNANLCPQQNVPTTSRKNLKNIETFVEEEDSRLQCMTLEENVKKFGITYFGLADKRQGIVHIIGPEQGFTLPGTTDRKSVV